MFASNVPEKLIQSRTGHRSLQSLRLYEQHQAVSNVLTGGNEVGKKSNGAQQSLVYGLKPPSDELSMVVTTPNNVRQFGSEVENTHGHSTHVSASSSSRQEQVPGLSSLFTNCTTTIVININPTINSKRSIDTEVENEFDLLISLCSM